MIARAETVEEFLARGGKIRHVKSGADKYAAKIAQYNLSSKFHYGDRFLSGDVVTESQKSRRAQWCRNSQRNKYGCKSKEKKL